MIFGMPTLIETPTLEACAKLCRSLGLSFIELNMNLPQYQLNQIDIAYFKDIARKYDIGYTIHLDENLNISDFNPYIAQAYQRTVKDTIAIAKALDVPILNMHLPKGVYFTLPDKKVFLFDEFRSYYLNSMTQFRDNCKKTIGDSPITICIENCDGFLPFQQEAIDLLLESPVFGLTFDIGHNHSIGGIDEPFILERTQRLRHMHIHDAAGKQNHMALGTGEIDLPTYFSVAEAQNCRVVLETKTIEGLKESVYWAARYSNM